MATLADLIGDTTALRGRLRRAVGYPTDTVLLPDATVDDVVADALRRTNGDWPLPSVGTFTTVAGQQDYTPLPASAYGFRRVYWPPDALCAGDRRAYLGLVGDLAPLLSLPIDEEGTRLAADPAVVMAKVRRATWLRALSTDGAVLMGRTVYLMPTPATTGATVIFTYNQPRYASAAVVREEHLDALLTYAEARLHDRLAGGAAGVEVVRDGEEGSEIRLRSPAYHAQRAEKREADYHGMRPPPPAGPVWP